MWTILVLLIILIGISIIASQYAMHEGLSVYHCPAYNGGKLLGETLKNLDYTSTSNKNADLYIPCGYTFVETELAMHKPTSSQKILAIDGCDKIVAKDLLWQTLQDEWGRPGASEITPEAFICRKNNDMNLLRDNHRPGDIYIMKKNVQRQQGLKITSNLNEIFSSKGNYAVIQRYIKNPYLVDGRKFDIRVFMLIVQRNGQQYYYRHSGGRCHYSGKDFSLSDLSDLRHIPSGYNEDAKFKREHPETLQELQEYLYNKEGIDLFTRIDKNLQKCSFAFKKVLGKKFPNNICAQLFGLDFVITNTFQPMLIEINKGPEMSWSSPKEESYKRQIVEDMINIVNDELVSSDFNLVSVIECSR